jgi:hypothetical protein
MGSQVKASKLRKGKPTKPVRKYRYVAGIECPACEARIWSRYGHDFRYCPCHYCFVDGGRGYLRYGWGDPDHPSGLKEVPTVIKMRIYEDDPDYRYSEVPKKRRRGVV